jgi:hypothetical protein
MSAIVHALATAAALASAHPWPHGDPNAVARSILNQSAYAKAGTSSDAKPAPGFWDIVWKWLGDHLGPILGPVFKRIFGGMLNALGKSGTGSVLGLVLIVVSLLGLIYALVRLILAFVRPAVRRSRAYTGLALGERGSPEEWRTVARDAAARGDFRRAIAALFAAAVAALDERRVVRFDPARTPGEYRRLVRRSAGPAAPPFDELTERFVRASFAEIEATNEDFGGALGALDRFEPAIPAPSATQA